MRIKRHYFDVAHAGGIMSGAVGKVAVLKKGTANTMANIAMVGLAPFTGGASLAPMLAGTAGKKILTTAGARLAAAKSGFQGARAARAAGVVPNSAGVTAHGTSPMRNAWEALRGREYTQGVQNWTPDKLTSHLQFTNPKTGAFPETGFQDWLKNPANKHLTSPQKTLAAWTPGAEGAATQITPTHQKMTGARSIYAREMAGDASTAMGHGTQTPGFNAIDAAVAPQFTSTEVGALTAGGLGATSAASQIGSKNQAKVAQQAEEAQKLQERAAGAATGTTGSTQMGRPNPVAVTG